MNQLTFADRELLLETLDALRQEGGSTDDELLAGAADWAKRLEPRFGFEHDLIRSAVGLSRYLSQHKNRPDVADIARGALRYFLLGADRQPSSLARFDLLDDAFIAAYAMQEIRDRLGETALYSAPRLTEEEQFRAESLFLELAASPSMNDMELALAAEAAKGKLGGMAGFGLFGRFVKNIDFLVAVLGDAARGVEQRSYARAALCYLACEDDAIDDRLGLVGFLDDNFIAQMAVDLIDPTRQPWLKLLDAAVGALPFLNSLVIDDGSGARPYSEYMIVNSALSSRVVRAENEIASTVVVTPLIGPTPFLLGLATTLGVIADALRRSTDSTSFRIGQKVLVDFEAVRIFSGFETTSDGRRLFRLTKENRRAGESKPYSQTRTFPESDLWRLVPAPRHLKTRGDFAGNVSHAEARLTALESLFSAARTIHTHNLDKKVVLVMPVLAAKDLARRLRVHGYPIKDAVPMGSLAPDGSVTAWSPRFGNQEPLLVVASDLDVASIFAEQNIHSVELVIVDARGRNAAKTASLRRLESLGVRTVLLARERAANPLIEDRAISTWWWAIDDLHALLWPEPPSGRAGGVVARYERRLHASNPSEPHLVTVPSAVAADAFAAVSHLKSLAKARGDDSLDELEEAVTLAFRAISWLMRCAVPIPSGLPTAADIEGQISQLRRIPLTSAYLSTGERAATMGAADLLDGFFNELKGGNGKAVALEEWLSERAGATIIAPDRRTLRDIEWWLAGRDVRLLYDYDDERDDELQCAIVPAWFGKDRMAALLTPPVADPLIFLLYDVERHWYESFEHAKRETRRAASQIGRSTLFAAVPGWKTAAAGSTAAGSHSATCNAGDPEVIRDHIRASFRSRALASAAGASDDERTDARLVVFEGQSYAFLTESYRANVVTHLLDDTVSEIEDGDVDVKRKTADELKPGDLLLFLRRSDRDLIRLSADGLLPDGLRETASLWRTALLNYAERDRLSARAVWHRLRDCGCRLKEPTIKGWLDDEQMIGPREYRQDVPIIVQATGDAELHERLADVIQAIGQVFSAHQQASRNIARKVLEKAIGILAGGDVQSKLVEIDSDIVMVRVSDIDTTPRKVRSSLVNRLEEADLWHE